MVAVIGVAFARHWGRETLDRTKNVTVLPCHYLKGDTAARVCGPVDVKTGSTAPDWLGRKTRADAISCKSIAWSTFFKIRPVLLPACVFH